MTAINSTLLPRSIYHSIPPADYPVIFSFRRQNLQQSTSQNLPSPDSTTKTRTFPSAWPFRSMPRSKNRMGRGRRSACRVGESRTTIAITPPKGLTAVIARDEGRRPSRGFSARKKLAYHGHRSVHRFSRTVGADEGLGSAENV